MATTTVSKERLHICLNTHSYLQQSNSMSVEVYAWLTTKHTTLCEKMDCALQHVSASVACLNVLSSQSDADCLALQTLICIEDIPCSAELCSVIAYSNRQLCTRTRCTDRNHV